MPGPDDADTTDVSGAVRVVTDPGHALLVGVAALLHRATATDPSPPLNEAALLALKHPDRSDTRHLVAVRDEAPVGYAQLAADGTGQLVVDPPVRRQGIGRRLVESLLGLVGEEHGGEEHGGEQDSGRQDGSQQDGGLRVWALGDSPAAHALARRTGLVPARTLLIMTRPLADLPEPVVPEGVTITTFRVGVDEQAWLTVNARAFAHHPEQGSIDGEDLAERMGEAWFDPQGFFLARGSTSASEGNPAGGVGGRPPSGQGSASASEGNPAGGVGGRPPSGRRGADDHDGPLLGFHWTKEHGDRLGEVYVLGVDPDAQGRGLAKALLLTGLAHLRDGGDEVVELYVEADQPGPVGLYRAYGFTEASRDVMYAGPGSGAAVSGP